MVQVLKHVIRGDHPLRQTPVQAEPVEHLKRRWIVLTWHHELALHVEVVEHRFNSQYPLLPAREIHEPEAQLQHFHPKDAVELMLTVLWAHQKDQTVQKGLQPEC